MSYSSDLVLIGKILSAHGIRGTVKIHSYTEQPSDIVKYGPIFIDKDKQINIKIERILQNGILLSKIDNISDRTTAETLRNKELFILRNNLPQTTNTDSFYVHDLLGVKVFDENNNSLGSVISVQNYGAGDLLEIGTKEKTKLILFHNNYIKEIDLNNNKIVIFND